MDQTTSSVSSFSFLHASEGTPDGSENGCSISSDTVMSSESNMTGFSFLHQSSPQADNSGSSPSIHDTSIQPSLSELSLPQSLTSLSKSETLDSSSGGTLTQEPDSSSGGAVTLEPDSSNGGTQTQEVYHQELPCSDHLQVTSMTKEAPSEAVKQPLSVPGRRQVPAKPNKKRKRKAIHPGQTKEVSSAHLDVEQNDGLIDSRQLSTVHPVSLTTAQVSTDSLLPLVDMALLVSPAQDLVAPEEVIVPMVPEVVLVPVVSAGHHSPSKEDSTPLKEEDYQEKISSSSLDETHPHVLTEDNFCSTPHNNSPSRPLHSSPNPSPPRDISPPPPHPSPPKLKSPSQTDISLLCPRTEDHADVTIQSTTARLCESEQSQTDFTQALAIQLLSYSSGMSELRFELLYNYDNHKNKEGPVLILCDILN